MSADLVTWLRAQLDKNEQWAPRRRILDIHEPYDSEETGAARCWMCGPGEYTYPCTTVQLLALPYSDRPGYREEWRP